MQEGAFATERPLRDQVDLDSMDWLNFMTGLEERLRIDIPEGDYARLVTLDDLVVYVHESMESRGALGSSEQLREELTTRIRPSEDVEALESSSVAAYAARFTRTRSLSDGSVVTIRPIRPDDASRVCDFLTDLSEESRYMRFQRYLRFERWVDAPSRQLIHFLTDVDYEQRMAFVCTVSIDNREELVGEARYVVMPDGKSCELGIMIADSWQHTGIAGLLMETLIRVAHDRGLATMEGIVLRANVPMLRFARALGFSLHPEPDDRTTVHIAKKL